MHVSRLARILGGLAVGAFALFLVGAVPQAVSRAAGMLRFADSAGGETFAAARARFFGPAYVGAVDAIRQALPPDQAYLLVEAGRPQDGDLYWVRFDLAPRRAVYLGQLDELTDARRLRLRLLGKVRQVVVAYGPGEPPRLLERHQLVDEIERRGHDGDAGASGAPGGPDILGVPGAARTTAPAAPPGL